MDNQNHKSELSNEAILETARRLGLNYQETLEQLAKTTGGRGTHIYSDTNVEKVKRQNELSMKENKNQNH